MTTFNLTINGANKIYNTLEEAKKVFERALKFYKGQQSIFDGVQVLDYMAIDKLKEGQVSEFDLMYIEGSELM